MLLELRCFVEERFFFEVLGICLVFVEWSRVGYGFFLGMDRFWIYVYSSL